MPIFIGYMPRCRRGLAIQQNPHSVPQVPDFLPRNLKVVPYGTATLDSLLVGSQSLLAMAAANNPVHLMYSAFCTTNWTHHCSGSPMITPSGPAGTWLPTSPAPQKDCKWTDRSYWVHSRPCSKKFLELLRKDSFHLRTNVMNRYYYFIRTEKVTRAQKG